MTQRALPFAATTRDRFATFHEAHPEVYAEIVRRARLAQSRNIRCGMRTIWEAMRWTFCVERTEQYKLNDHFPPHYARLVMERESDLAGFFETRGLRAA